MGQPEDVAAAFNPSARCATPGPPAPGWAWAACLLLPVVSALAVGGLVMLCAP